jgi:hypothetical protein
MTLDPNLKAKLELVASIFMGGAVGYLTTHIGDGIPTTSTQWEAFGIGAATMGLNAVYHRFQTAPADVAAVKAMAARMAATVTMLVCLVGLGVVASGCALFQSVEKNPVVAATTLVQVLNDADGVATAAFNAAEPLLPASQQAQATADWAKGQTTLQNAEVALEDAAQAYEAGTSQNWGALVTAAKGAFDAVVAILDLYGATLMGASKVALSSPVFATQRAQLALRVAVIHRYH